MARKRSSATPKKIKPVLAEAAPEPDTELPQAETAKMEVHHHPEVEKKGLKEYLLEGLMIFVAVLMGFIAENVRENYTEHSKAKAFAVTMVADLKADTLQLNKYLAYYRFAKMNTDTLMKLLSNNDIKNIPSGKLYLYGLWGGGQSFFIPNDATFQQMKSTGALQYLERKVARNAAEYDRLCRGMQKRDESEEAVYVEVRKLRSQIFEFQYNTAANDLWQKTCPGDRLTNNKNNLALLDAYMKSNPPLLTNDKALFNQYAELVRSRYLYRKVSVADSVLAHATGLLNDVKSEYHIDE